MTILNKRYSHFEKKLEAQDPGTLKTTKLETELLRVKEELLGQYQLNHELKCRLHEGAPNAPSSVSNNSKHTPISSSEIFGESVVQHSSETELQRLEQHYKVTYAVIQEEILRLQAELEQQGRQCTKCRDMTKTIIVLNEELNSLKKNETVDYALLINNIIIKQSEDMIAL